MCHRQKTDSLAWGQRWLAQGWLDGETPGTPNQESRLGMMDKRPVPLLWVNGDGHPPDAKAAQVPATSMILKGSGSWPPQKTQKEKQSAFSQVQHLPLIGR